MPRIFTAILIASLTIGGGARASLEELEERIRQDLKLIEYPEPNWVLSDTPEVLDVALIGGGMAGTTAAFALQRLGVSRLHIFDENGEGLEGPWQTTARMKTLQSRKTLTGPALGIPSLTFQAWHRARFGDAAWEMLERIPTTMWGDYLYWFRKVLHLPVTNNAKLIKVHPGFKAIELTFDVNGTEKHVLARKVVLATGRGGCGGLFRPDFARSIPAPYCFHAGEPIDFSSFKGLDVAVIGAGASAIDLAITAAENQAANVAILVRRNQMPKVNKLTYFLSPGSGIGFFGLNDISRTIFMGSALSVGVPPPDHSLEELAEFDSVSFHMGTFIKECRLEEGRLKLTTNRGELQCDRLLLGTGFEVDIAKQPYMDDLADNILLWDDRLRNIHPRLGKFPYLGRHFQLQPKEPGSAPYLRNIHYFNFGAFMSHGVVSGEIAGIARGASRLAEGIVMDLFVQQKNEQWQAFKKHNEPVEGAKTEFASHTLFIDFDRTEEEDELAELIFE